MKLRILSDLHIDYPVAQNLGAINAKDEDILIVPGDLANHPTKGLDYIMDWFECPIVFVPGNHEHYGGSLASVRADLEDFASRQTDVHVLIDKAIEINGIKFIGSTFWSNFMLYGPASLWTSMAAAEKYINDFRLIKLTETQWLKARDVVELNRAAEKFINAELGASDPAKTVLVTHFATQRKSVHEMFAGDICTPYFVSDMPQWINKCKLMVHGHCHTAFDYTLGDTRVVCNPSGYRGEKSGFNPDLIVEV